MTPKFSKMGLEEKVLPPLIYGLAQNDLVKRLNK